jgi:hypothetical protein
MPLKKLRNRLEIPCFSACQLIRILKQLTVKIDGSLNDVVTKNVAVRKILGDDGGLESAMAGYIATKLTAGLSS